MTAGRKLIVRVCVAGLSACGLASSGVAETAEPGIPDADKPVDVLAESGAGSNSPRRPGRIAHWSDESTRDLHRHCRNLSKPLSKRGVRDGFTSRCEARLDQRFLDEVPVLMPIAAEENTLTWRHAFDDPLGKRRIVLDVLADPECQVADDEVRHDLAQRCSADLVADYAVLKYKCASGLYRVRGRIEPGIREPWKANVAHFRHAWHAAKCAGVPPEALASLNVFPDSMEFLGEPALGEEHWWWAEQGFEAYQLMGIADRLAAHITRTEYGYEPGDISTWQRVQPVMAEVLKVKDPGRYETPAERKMARLKHAVATTWWMRIRRVNVDTTWLMQQVGVFTQEEYDQATESAHAMMTMQDAESYFR